MAKQQSLGHFQKDVLSTSDVCAAQTSIIIFKRLLLIDFLLLLRGEIIIFGMLIS